MMDGFEHLKVELEDDGRLALLRFDHGKANEMGTAQLRELERFAQALEDPEGPRVVITWSDRVSSRGTPIFVAGADVTERAGWSALEIKEHVRWQRRVLAIVRQAPVFHVAVVHGVALGWGTEYCLVCDYRIACDDARFGLPETGLGIVPGAGGTSELWSHVGVPQALRLGMTGEQIDADEAYAMGLVQERLPDVGAGLERARALAARVVTRSPTAVAAFKRAVLTAIGKEGVLRSEEEARAYEHCVDSGDAAVGRRHFDEIRQGGSPPWRGRVPWRPLNS